MSNWSLMNHRLQSVSLRMFKKLCKNHDIVIGDGDLKIILRIIKNNPYSVLNEDYTPILLFEISQETDKTTCDKIKPMIVERYLIKEME
ncbi:MAG: DUF2624 family protein [Longibaculum sp.]